MSSNEPKRKESMIWAFEISYREKMFIYDIKNAICNKKMVWSILLGFLCLMVGGAEILFSNYNEGIDFSYLFLFSFSCGASSLLALIYPVFACMPYSDIYEVERSSGYILYKRMKIRKWRYILSKLSACALSGGIAVSLPVAVYLMICIKMRGTNLVNGGMQYITHGISFYQQYPVQYCLGYVWNAFWCGMIFSLMGLAVSVFLKNRYLIIFFPLVIYIFLNILFSGTFINLNPTLWWDINLYAESSIGCVIFIKIFTMLIFSGIFLLGVIKDENE